MHTLTTTEIGIDIDIKLFWKIPILFLHHIFQYAPILSQITRTINKKEHQDNLFDHVQINSKNCSRNFYKKGIMNAIG